MFMRVKRIPPILIPFFLLPLPSGTKEGNSPMPQIRQTVPEAIRDIRTNLQFSAEYLRRFDKEEAEQIAKRLDRLRWDLKRFTTKKTA